MRKIKKGITEKIRTQAINFVRAPKNLVFRAAGIPLKPRRIVFMVTDRCNSRCTHCSIWQQKPTENPLTPNEIEKIFSNELFSQVEYILCTGGEITVRNDLEEVILRLHKVLPKATIQLSTNALLPDKVLKIVNRAIENNINIEVGISLDGIGEVHDMVRGVKGNFEKADYLLRELVKLREKHKEKLSVGAGLVISDLTLSAIPDVRAYAKELGVDLVEAWYNESSFYHNIGKNPLREKIIETVKSQPASLIKESWLKMLNGKTAKFPCFAMNNFFVLKCNGDIVPCLSLWDERVGNVRESSLVTVWRSRKAKDTRQLIRNCQGCLNSWAAGWSFESAFYPYLIFGIKHPVIAIKKAMRS